jgi:hypothetical protein
MIATQSVMGIVELDLPPLPPLRTRGRAAATSRSSARGTAEPARSHLCPMNDAF